MTSPEPIDHSNDIPHEATPRIDMQTEPLNERCLRCPIRQHIALELIELRQKPQTQEIKSIIRSYEKFEVGVSAACHSQNGPIMSERRSIITGKLIVRRECASNLGKFYPNKLTKSKSVKR